jgi:transposase
MTTACVAGIDAGKFYLDVGMAPSGRTFRVANAPDGIDQIVARLHQAGVAQVVLEAIGPYARSIVTALSTAGFSVGLVNPRRIKAFRDAEGHRAKTDRLDAGLIARFAMRMSEVFRPLPTESQQAIKALAARRRQLVEMIAIEKTRLKQTGDHIIVASHRTAIAVLAEERQRIETELATRIAADPALTRRYEILVSIPGVGPTIATTLIADLPELGSTDRRSIASLAGLAPHPDQSGIAPSRNHIAGGRPCVRAALYMAGLVACRADPRARAEYRAGRDAGKPAKVAIIAVARKLLVRANALIRDDQLYQPDRSPELQTH